MKKLIALVLAIAFIGLSGCVTSNNVRTKTKNKSKGSALNSSTSEVVTEDIDFLDEGENLTEYYVENAYEFRDGYAVIKFTSYPSRGNYYGIINSDGRITYAFYNDSSISYKHHSDGKFYFKRYQDAGYELFCINNVGESIYNLIFYNDENVDYANSDALFYDDGSLIVTRKYSSYSEGSFDQIAKYDPQGNCDIDWTRIDVEGRKHYSYSVGSSMANGYVIMDFVYIEPKETKSYLVKVDDDFSIVADLSSEEFNTPIGAGCFIYENLIFVQGNLTVADSEDDYCVYNRAENCIFNLKTEAKVTLPEGSKIGSNFINGYAILYLQKENNYYCTLVDTGGNIMFEPKPYRVDYNYRKDEFFWDGTRFLFVKDYHSTFLFYDVNGELQREVNVSDINSVGDDFSEGYACGRTFNGGCYVKYDGTVLLPGGTVSVDTKRITQIY